MIRTMMPSGGDHKKKKKKKKDKKKKRPDSSRLPETRSGSLETPRLGV